MPGLLAVSPAEPPPTISDSSPPKDSITPAVNCGGGVSERACAQRGEDDAYGLEEDDVGAHAVLGDTVLDHRRSDLSGLQCAWGVHGV